MLYLYPPQPILTEHGGDFGLHIGTQASSQLTGPDHPGPKETLSKWISVEINVNSNFNLYKFYYTYIF